MGIILHKTYFKNSNWARVFSQYRIACDDDIDTNNNDDKDYDMTTMILMITMTMIKITT